MSPTPLASVDDLPVERPAFALALPLTSWALPFTRWVRSPIRTPPLAVGERSSSRTPERETPALGEVRRGRADLLELFLQLFRPLEVGGRELAPELALARAQQQLLGGLLVDPLGRRARVELGQQRDKLLVRLARVEQMLPRATVQLGVEMVWRELGEQLAQLGVGRHSGQRVSLQPEAFLQQARADLPRRAAGAAGGEAGLRFLRQVEPVGREPDGVLPLRRVLEAREHLTHAHEGFLPVRRSLDLEADAVREVALGPPEQLVELAGQ